MNDNSPPPVGPMCFMRVPKSGGSNITVALGRALRPEAICPRAFDTSLFGDFSDFDALGPHVRARVAVTEEEVAELLAYDFVSGHFSLPTLLSVTSPKRVATVLREPRARLLSHYAYMRLRRSVVRDIWRFWPDEGPGTGRSVDEFLTDPMLAPHTDNIVCRMLLGPGARIPETGFIAPSELREVAADGLAALDTLGYTGVLETGDRVWDGLSEFVGVPLAPNRANERTSWVEFSDARPVDCVITAHTLRLLEARTAADAVVFKQAVLAGGCSRDQADHLRATAFASELVRLGNVIGTSSVEARERGQRIDDLTLQLDLRQNELGSANAQLSETGKQLHQAAEELGRHRAWLADIQGSASWRITEPLRAAKRTISVVRPSQRRPVPRLGPWKAAVDLRVDLEWIWGLRGLGLPIWVFHWRARRLARQAGDPWITAATRPRDLQILLRVANGRKRVVELGTGGGWTALTLALDDQQRRITTYDVQGWERERYTSLVPASVLDRIDFVRAPGSTGPLEPYPDPVDLLYIDSSHEAEPTIEEVKTWLRYLAPGAAMVFDDFTHQRYTGVAEAVGALGLAGEQAGTLFIYRHNASEPVIES